MKATLLDIDELACLLFHTYWGAAPSFNRESLAVQEEWRKVARAAFAHTMRRVIAQEGNPT